MGKQGALTILVYLTVCQGSQVLKKDFPKCNQKAFDRQVSHYCIPMFNDTMEALNYEVKCPWPTPKTSYSALMKCMDDAASATKCIDPLLMNTIFLKLHQQFFSLCPSKPEDPDLHIVLLLVLPCVVSSLLFPFFCICLILKTANEGCI